MNGSIILDTCGDTFTLKRRRNDDADKDQEPPAGSDRGSKRRREGKEPESASALQEKATRSDGKSTQGSESRQMSASESATTEEPIQTTFEIKEPSHPEFETGDDDQPIVEPSLHPEWNLYKALVDAYESDKIILDTYRESVTLKRRRDDDEDKDEEPSAGPDRGSKRRREGKEPESASTPSETATKSAGRQTNQFARAVSSIPGIVNHYMDQRMNEAVKIAVVNEQLEDEVLTRSSHSSRTSYAVAADLSEMELKKILIEKMEGNKLGVEETQRSKEPESTSAPTETATRSAGRSTQGSRSRQASEPPTLDRDWNKTLPVVHGSIQPWISELAKQADSRSSFNELMDTPLDFSNFLINWLKHSYKHLDWITIRRDDDNLYKFKEGDFKRLRIQDIEDMLLLLVQGKLTNLAIEECCAFNVSLRMFTRSIVIQRRVEDLQLGVESYQKRLNLTKLDSYRSDLKRKEAYTAYSNPHGFIYQNKDKRNKLMRIDELYKFSDVTLTDVLTALNDHLKGIQMQYLPQSIWRKSDKDRAAAMIQAIDKRLKTRRIMRSLERCVGGRLYEGDFRMLQRTI
nr:hypothetical protein [Tanacetum cinerariifolium]